MRADTAWCQLGRPGGGAMAVATTLGDLVDAVASVTDDTAEVVLAVAHILDANGATWGELPPQGRRPRGWRDPCTREVAGRRTGQETP
jgi:hypothetical protein